MKKISYILGISGIILIFIAIVFLNLSGANDNKSNYSWTTEYQKGEFSNKDIPKYEVSSYKKIIINQDNNYYYIIPEDAYLFRVGNHYTKYQNDKISVMQYNFAFSNNEIPKILDSYNDYAEALEVSKCELPNGNILIHEKVKDDSFSEKLYLFIKVDDNNYYQLYYQINNLTFGDTFINDVIDMVKYRDEIINCINKDNEWKCSIDSVNKKVFNLSYDLAKYYKDDLSYDYELYLHIGKDSPETVNVSIDYDSSGIDENIYTAYTISNNKKIKLRDYNSLVYTITTSYGNVYINYEIIIDNYTKLKVSYPKSIENEVNINDFLNFTYE